MTNRKTRAILALVALTTLVLTACGNRGENPPPPPPSSSSTTPPPPSVPAAPADLMIGGVSLNGAVKYFERVVELGYDVKYVADGGEAVKCPVSGEAIEGDAKNMMLCGDMTTLVIPEKVDFGFNPPKAGVVFFVAQTLAYSVKEYDSELAVNCLAGYVAHRSPSSAFNTASLATLKGYLLGYRDGQAMHAGASYGIVFSQKNMSRSECKDPAVNYDRIPR